MKQKDFLLKMWISFQLVECRLTSNSDFGCIGGLDSWSVG